MREGVEYNYRRGDHPLTAAQVPEPVARFAASCGTDGQTFMRDRPGMSAFAMEEGVVYHAYSTYARGLDGLWGSYQWLDRAPKGRNERASGGDAMTNTAPIHINPFSKPEVEPCTFPQSYRNRTGTLRASSSL